MTDQLRRVINIYAKARSERAKNAYLRMGVEAIRRGALEEHEEDAILDALVARIMDRNYA